jgi:catechol 2,3-dioxygenase-like lactoylglutathione lyase family enzyme
MSDTYVMKFEAAVIPVSDVDRAKAFYLGLGRRLDADFPIDEHFRIVQLTPAGARSGRQHLAAAADHRTDPRA